MLKQKTIAFTVLFLSLTLTACGGSSDNSGGSDTESTLFTENAAAQELVGVYDESETYNGYVDEYYFVITKDGNIFSYDYLGDSSDNIANCYIRYYNEGDSLSPKGNNLYDLTNNFYRLDESYGLISEKITTEVQIVLINSGNTLQVTYTNPSDVSDFITDTTFEIPKATKQITDLTPLCEDIGVTFE